MAKRSPPRSVRCYHCGQPLEVSGKAQSTSCPACNGRVIVQDVEVAVLTPVHEIQTCGRLVVTKKGTLIAKRVQALGGVDVLGRMEANVESGGTVHIAAGARWRGDCSAPAVTIDPGARIEGGRFSVPSEPRYLAAK
ncbi:MAG: polymer-forming cytoskeletal protein [Planctomycetes bacterium]|nr:polymer-forming cytoskeletal protein [Planctomycetota bacterium]